MKLIAFILCIFLTLSHSHAAPPTTTTVIEWDRDSLHLVAADGSYARIAILRSGTWLAGFSRGKSVWASRSDDRGRTWSEAVCVAEPLKPHGWNVTNSELLELSDDRVMYFYNERENVRGTSQPSREPDNGIGVAISRDGGKTWAAGQRVCGGGKMWEPAGIEVDSPDKKAKEIWMLFADETPFVGTGQQRSARCISRDGGATWTPPAVASFRPGCRDGMPVPLRLADGYIVMAIEDNGVNPPPKEPSKFGWFKPEIVELAPDHSTDGPINPRRWPALTEPLADAAYAGAPYLARVGSHVLLSSQVDDMTPGDGGRRKMFVWVGDATAHGFGQVTKPFGAVTDAKSEQTWSSLTTIDDHHVLAVTGTTVGGRSGIWSIEGRVP